MSFFKNLFGGGAKQNNSIENQITEANLDWKSNYLGTDFETIVEKIKLEDPNENFELSFLQNLRELNYSDSFKAELVEFIQKNKFLFQHNANKYIKNQISYFESKYSRSALDKQEYEICGKNINFLKAQLEVENLFCMSNKSFFDYPDTLYVFFIKNHNLFIADCSYYFQEPISPFDISDIEFIYNHFEYPFLENGELMDDLSSEEKSIYNAIQKDINDFVSKSKELTSNNKDTDWLNLVLDLHNEHEFKNSIKVLFFFSNLLEIVNLEQKSKLLESQVNQLFIDTNRINLIDNDFDKLIHKYESKIASIDKTYIHKFVKMSTYINAKKMNIEKFFSNDNFNNPRYQVKNISFLVDQIDSYNLLLFHSINMVVALMNENMIPFYEIYERFDKLGMYNSNWENEVSQKLGNIEEKLDDLILSITRMEQRIINELADLNYTTQSSFQSLNETVCRQLEEVESSINTNNLLAGIQNLQLRKLNKQISNF